MEDDGRPAAGLQHPVALLDEPLRVGRVLDDSVRVDEIEGVVWKRQRFAVGDAEVAAQPLLFEVGACEIDRRAGNVDPGNIGAALRKPGQVDASATPDLENAAPSVTVKADETRQVMKLLEVILIEVVEESARPDGMTRDLEIVDVLIPVRPNVVYRRHGQHYTIAAGLNGPR